LNTVLLGHGSLALALAQGLISLPSVNLLGIYPWCHHPGSRYPDFHAQLDAPLKALALQHQIPLLALGQTDQADFIDWLSQHHIQWIQLGCWGEILKPSLIDRPQLAIINCHPSPLPWHKGPNPYASVIRQGETQTAVTFHRVDAGVDTGPIVLQIPVPVKDNDTGGTLQASTDRAAYQAVPQLVSRLCLAEGVREQPQQDAGSYFANIQQTEALVQWCADPLAVERNSRALLPWLEPYAYWNADTLMTFKRLKLMKSDPPHNKPAGSLLGLSAGSCLVASRDVYWHYRLENYRLVMGGRILPRILSQTLGKWLLRPEWGGFWHHNMLETAY
jgi:methionyl-tRNA formyltransferase